MIDFPNTPTIGQIFTTGGLSWTWDGSKWNMSATAGGPYVPLAGGTMTGPLVLSQDPVAPLGAATKNYVDDVIASDNRIINGDMRIDQRNNGVSGTASAYTVDRWQYVASQPNKGTWTGRVSTNRSDFPYGLYFTASSSYASLAADYFIFSQPIEADMVTDFQWGTANAQPVTLSFWCFCTLSGTFSGSIRNVANNRSYPFPFSLTANTWKFVVITIPGDTAGTWALSGNGSGLNVNFDLGSGTANRGPANAWGSSPYLGVTGAASVVATNSAAIYLTGVKLEVGSVATPFNRYSLAKSLADCQRYFQTVQGWGMNIIGNGSYGGFLLPVFFQTMRATPTASNIGVIAPAGGFTGTFSLAGVSINSGMFVPLTTQTSKDASAGVTAFMSAEI